MSSQLSHSGDQALNTWASSADPNKYPRQSSCLPARASWLHHFMAEGQIGGEIREAMELAASNPLVISMNPLMGVEVS